MGGLLIQHSKEFKDEKKGMDKNGINKNVGIKKI